MKRIITTTFFAVFLLVIALPSKAQVAIDLGPRVGYDIGGDVEEFFIGADARFGIPDFPVDLGATFDYFFTDGDLSFFQLSMNAYYDFILEDMSFVPYAGAGLGISRVSVDSDLGPLGSYSYSDTDTGINLIGGARFTAGNMYPFAQVQLTFGDLDLLTIGGGILFPIGR